MSRLPFEQMIASLRPACSSSSNEGTIAGADAVVVVIASPLSHTAVGLRQPGDVGHLLAGPLGEERELLLDRDAADRLHAPRRRRLTAVRVVRAEEPDGLPVLVG